MNKIENIIFDFGGVLYNIDVERSMNTFKTLGFNFSEHKNEILQVFIDLEIGKISPTDFVIKLQRLSDTISEKDILDAFNLILIGIDPGKVEVLRKIKDKYRIYLLSNTNEIHYGVFSNEINNNELTTDFYSLFEKEYYSHEMGMRKPDLSIFQYVLTNSKLEASKTLFVDDSFENITAASSLGIQTFWIENADSWNKLTSLLNIKL